MSEKAEDKLEKEEGNEEIVNTYLAKTHDFPCETKEDGTFEWKKCQKSRWSWRITVLIVLLLIIILFIFVFLELYTTPPREWMGRVNKFTPFSNSATNEKTKKNSGKPWKFSFFVYPVWKIYHPLKMKHPNFLVKLYDVKTKLWVFCPSATIQFANAQRGSTLSDNPPPGTEHATPVSCCRTLSFTPRQEESATFLMKPVFSKNEMVKLFYLCPTSQALHLVFFERQEEESDSRKPKKEKEQKTKFAFSSCDQNSKQKCWSISSKYRLACPPSHLPRLPFWICMRQPAVMVEDTHFLYKHIVPRLDDIWKNPKQEKRLNKNKNVGTLLRVTNKPWKFET